ncbi:MAG: hypothetical protein LBL04_09550 [Bacteroidales bacterium]|nr:hypothetical protein [Bacteroidales bacterium]
MRHLLLFVAAFMSVSALAVDLTCYLPQSASYSKSIPTPESVLGFQVGEWHASHEQALNYIRAVAAASDRVKLVHYGYSHEKRPLCFLIFTSPENLKNLEQIKEEHLKLSDPSVSGSVDTGKLPVFTWLGHSIHGNEASGINAALLLVYHLAAANDAETLRQLDESVIFVDPAINPDGINRFAEWVNLNKSIVPNDDTQEREHSEPWPGGRGNHYWFDLNRDWLNLQQPESQARIAALLEWRPNVYTDAHEQGTNANYHFSPGEPTRVHPLIPDRAQDFIRRMASDFYAPAFDARKMLYFSGEVFDDYYPGRGREYLDFHGGIAILWEQPSSRGYVQSSVNGKVTFELGILNQLTAGLATIRGGHAMRQELLDYQKWYFKQALDDAAKDPVKAYVFGTPSDKASAYRLAELVTRNGIDVYGLAKPVEANGKKFDPATAWIVPLNRKQHKLIHAIFEIRETYRDSVSYDITGWTLPFAFNLDNAKLTVAGESLLGEKFELDRYPVGQFTGNREAYAYAFEWGGYYAPRALYRLLDAGILAKVSAGKFTGDGHEFDRGTIVIPLGETYQSLPKEEIDRIVDRILEEDALDVFALGSGYTAGHHLGSANFITVKKPRIAILGTGSAGEVWHLFDRRYNIPVSVIAPESIGRISLEKYSVIIVPGGTLPAGAQNALSEWVNAGNTLIGYESALNAFAQARLLDAAFVSENREYGGAYENVNVVLRAQGIAGVIFQTKIDVTHPLAWGYKSDLLPVFKNSSIILKKTDNRLSTPVCYTEKPLLAGNVLPRTVNRLAGTPVALLGNAGAGRVIGLAVNPNFRAIWYGTDRLTANAVFFGNCINPATMAARPSGSASGEAAVPSTGERQRGRN